MNKQIESFAAPEYNTPDQVPEPETEKADTWAGWDELEYYTVKLYRVSGPKRAKKYLKKFNCERPEEDFIGENYGGGVFAVMGNHPITGKLHCKYYYIDESFTEIAELKKQKEKAAAGLGSTPNMNLNSSVHNPLSQFKEMTEILKNLMPNQDNTPIKMIEGITDMFTSGLKKMQNAVIDKEIGKMKEEEPEPESSDIQSIVKMISDFGGKFLEARGMQAEAYKALLQNDPRFAEAQENQDLISQIYIQCCADPKIGKSTIDEIMQRLDIDVPTDEPDPFSASEDIINSVHKGE